MKSPATRLMCATTALFLLAACTTNGGWTDMSGSFDGWHLVGNANWRIEDGEFVADSGNGHMVTDRSYDDFRITLEFFASDGDANSGVYTRIHDPESITDTSSYEINIWDNRPDQSGRTGAIPNYAPPLEVVDGGGKWNTFDITVQGDHITVVTNGITTVDTRDSTHPDAGPISLQYAAGTIKYRNVRIMAL